MSRTYQRSKILSFSALNEAQQKQAIEAIGVKPAVKDTYVLWNDEPIPMSKFDAGQYSQSAYSAFLLKVSQTGDCATVIYDHW